MATEYGCDLTKVKNPEKWVAGLGLPLVERRKKPPEPPGCLILEDLQTLHNPTNKKLEVWHGHNTGYFFLSFLYSFKTILRQRKICIKKTLRNHMLEQIPGQYQALRCCLPRWQMVCRQHPALQRSPSSLSCSRRRLR